MKFIAHRGFSLRFAENSLPAFQAVIEHPCNGRSLTGIELDIHLTGDGRIPVMHDTVIRDENGKIFTVARCTFEELQHRRKRAGIPGTLPIPAIEEVLDLVNHRTELCFDIKKGPYDLDRFCRCFASALDAYHPCGDVVVSSSSLNILNQVRSFLSRFDLRYGYIFKSFKALEGLQADTIRRFDLLHPHYRLVLHAPRSFQINGSAVRCWTVNDPDTIRRLTNLTPQVPIEAVMTDDIDLAEQFQDV
jgi:glycerophosphoryl diester phosphodiesterase